MIPSTKRLTQCIFFVSAGLAFGTALFLPEFTASSLLWVIPVLSVVFTVNLGSTLFSSRSVDAVKPALSQNRERIIFALLQLTMLVLSFFLFQLFVLQSHLNPKIEPISEEVLQAALGGGRHWVVLGFPWLFASVAGITWGKWVRRGGSAWPVENMVSKSLRFPIPTLFNFVAWSMSVPTQVLLFLLSAGCLESLLIGVTYLFGVPMPALSFFAISVATFIAVLLVRYGTKGVGWCVRKQKSMAFVVLMAVVGMFLLFSVVLDLFSPVTHYCLATAVQPSVVFGSLIPHATASRLALLLFFLGILWTPWLASLIADYSQRHSVWQTLVSALWLPSVVLYFGSSWCDPKSVFGSITMPYVLMIGVAFALGIKVCFGHITNVVHLNCGFLPPGQVKRRSLYPILTTWLRVLPIMIGGYLILGWPILEIVVVAVGLCTLVSVGWSGLLKNKKKAPLRGFLERGPI